jgi:tetratricopeptide (TPR) repeat protein
LDVHVEPAVHEGALLCPMANNHSTSGKRVSPKRTLNTRPLIYLCAFGLGLCLVLYVIHHLQTRRNAGALLEQAKQAESLGDLRTAEECLKLYLGYQPRNADAFARYAALLAARARSLDDWVRTLLTYDQVLRLDPDRRDIRRRLVDLAFELRAYHVARYHLDKLIESAAPDGGRTPASARSNSADLQLLLGRCYEGENEYSKAAACYERAIQCDPRDLDGYIRLAEILRNQLQDSAAADRVMDARETKDGLIAANNNSFRAYLERSRYRKRFKISGVHEDVERALQLAPNEPDARLAATELAIEKQDYEAARRHLTVGLEHSPKDWRLYRAMALVERATGHLKEADSCLRRGALAATDAAGRSQLLSLEIDVMIDSGESDQARGILQKLAREKLKPAILHYHSGRIYMSESKWIEAANELETVSSQFRENPELAYEANLLLGRCYEAIGDFDRRSEAFRRAIDLQPEGLSARLGRAAALRASGRVDEALGEYTRLSEEIPGLLPTVARLLILRNLRSPVPERNWRRVEEVLGQAEQKASGSSEVIVLRAETLAAQEQWGRAEEVLTKARDRWPGRVEFWVALSELAERRQSQERAMTLIEEAERRLGDSVTLRLARVNHWSKRGGPEAVAALAALSSNLAAFAVADQERVLRALAEAHLATGNVSGADQVISQLCRMAPEDLGLRFLRFELALQLGDRSKMEAIVGELAATEAGLYGSAERGGPFTQCAKARYLVWLTAQDGRDPRSSREIEEARLLLNKAATLRPTWSLAPLYEAELEDFAGNADPAIKGYLRAIELGMQNALVVRRTVQLLFERGRYDEADELLQTLEAKGVGARDSQLQKLAAEVSLQIRDPGQAVALARRAVPAESQDYRDRLWLAQILWAAGQSKEAIAQARAAKLLADAAPEPLLLLVQYLRRTGQSQDAIAAIRETENRLRGDYSLLALARCYAEVGDLEKAHDRFAKALSKRPDDIAILRAAVVFDVAAGRAAEAEAYLRKIRTLENSTKADDAWARRQLAAVLASGGDQRKVTEAMDLLGIVDEGSAYQPAIDESLDDLRAKARVLAARKSRRARRAAIRVLQHIIERDARAVDDRLLLTRLYEAEGDRSRSEREAMSLLDLDGQNPALLANAAFTFLRHGSLEQAASLLESLEKQEPNEFRTIALKARLLKAQGKGSEAAGQIQAFAAGKAAYIESAARLEEEIGEIAQAEALYRKLAAGSKRTEAALELAAFLGRNGRIDEALDECERAWAGCRAEAVGQLEVALLYSGDSDEKRVERVAESLKRELAKQGPNAGLLFQLGNVRSRQGRYQEAESLYRESHRRDQTNSGPLMNLAWLLARRDRKCQEALDLIAEAARLDGPTPDLVDTRSIVYITLGKSDLAIKDLEDVAGVEPSPLKYVHLAEAYAKANRTEDAKLAISEARTAGFVIERLSPLERESCQRLLVELAQN